jgi:hypothetical protein
MNVKFSRSHEHGKCYVKYMSNHKKEKTIKPEVIN